MIGPDHRAGRRLRETEAYFRFTREEMESTIERWKIDRKSLD